MLSWKDFYVQEQRRKDLLAEAEHARLVKRFTSQKESYFKKVSSQVLESVGSRLVKWGDSLRSRNADMNMASQG